MPDPIVAEGLHKSFKGCPAVTDVGFSVPEASVFGFLGPNGAGKTTTIRMLLGLLKPDAGSIVVNGADIRRERRRALRTVGAIVEAPALYPNLTGQENLKLACKMLRVPRTEIDRALGVVGLDVDTKKLVKAYSLGMRQRLGLARALLGSPKLLILDEPTNGLDPSGIRDMRALIADLPKKAGVTVLVSSHLLAEVEQIATHVGVMDRGRLLHAGSMASLLQQHETRIVVGVRETDLAIATLGSLGGPVALAGQGRVMVTVPGGQVPQEAAARINAMLVNASLSVTHLEITTPSLEDLFMKFTGGRPDDTPPAGSAGAAPTPEEPSDASFEEVAA